MANNGVVKFFFILTCLTVCSSGALVGFSFDARRSSKSSSPIPPISLLRKNKVLPSQIRVFVSNYKNLDTSSNTRLPVDLYLNIEEFQNLGISPSKGLAISWLKTHLSINIRNIIVGTSSSNSVAEKQLLLLIPTLKSIHSALKSMNLENQVRVSVGFSLSVLEKLHKEKRRDLGMVLSREEGKIFRSSRRELLHKDNKKLILETRRDLLDNFDPLTPVTLPIMNPTPTIVTVPSTIPVTVMPTNPAAVPVTVPNINPVVTPPITVPSTNPENPLVPGFPVTTPVSVPMTPPTMNPVTGFPFTPPVNNPITNPVTTPTMNNPPAGVGGQTWCVAKTGVVESSLQAALDYACGVGDCSAIQSTGSCYNPNTLQNHASYAFNSYYQKNPTPTSCNFGGSAMLVNNNPSAGSCVYPSSSSSTSQTPSTTTPTPSTTIPTSTTPPTTIPPMTMPPITIPPVTIPPTTTGGASNGLSPMVLNSSYPTSPIPGVYGTQPPPGGSSTTVSIAVGSQPLLGSFVLATTVATTILMMNF